MHMKGVVQHKERDKNWDCNQSCCVSSFNLLSLYRNVAYSVHVYTRRFCHVSRTFTSSHILSAARATKKKNGNKNLCSFRPPMSTDFLNNSVACDSIN